MQNSHELLQAVFGAPIDRRRFFKRTASGVILLWCGGLLPAGCSRYPKPAAPLRFLNSREYATLSALARRLLGAGAAIGSDGDEVDVGANVDALVAEWDAEAQGQLRTVLRIFEHGTYLFDLRRKRFTRLTAARQDEYIAGWMSSTLGVRRMVFRALKLLVVAGFYSQPRTWASIGYDGPWLGRLEAAPRLSPVPPTALSHLRSSGE
jgi:hypothetical protein